MFRLRSSGRAALSVAVLLWWAGCAFAQSAAQLESDSVKRVASHLACQCGSCKSTIACEMPGGCGYCKRVKTRIAQLQTAGKSDQDIIDQLVKESGESYLAPPGTFGWLTPYAAAAFGLLVIFWFVRRSLRAPARAAGPEVDAEVFDRYHAKIEKDLEKLE